MSSCFFGRAARNAGCAIAMLIPAVTREELLCNGLLHLLYAQVMFIHKTLQNGPGKSLPASFATRSKEGVGCCFAAQGAAV